MSYNGTGTFSINSAGQPVVTGTTITSTAFNTLTADLATGLSTALCKDGQSTPTANIGLGAFKITNLGAGTLATDAASVSQIQSGAATFVVASGTDTILGTGSPALTAYATGNAFQFTVAATNTTSVTLNIDSLGAKAVTRDGSTALVAGDLVSGSVVTVVYDGTRFQVLNSNSKTNFNLSGTLTAASTATASKFIPTGTSATGNGMYLPAANQLGFSTNGVARMTIASTGGVTIAAPTSGSALNLNNAASAIQLAVGNWDAMRYVGSALEIGGLTASQFTGLNFYTSAAQRMSITSAGKVGIGVTGPNALLSVSAASATGGSIADGMRVNEPTGGYGVNIGGNSSGYAFIQGLDGIVSTGSSNNIQLQPTGGGVIVGGTTGALYGTLQVYKAGSTAFGIRCGLASAAPQTVWASDTSGNNYFIEFATEGTYTPRGSITYNRAGNLTAYNTTSDYRLKEHIVDLPNALETVNKLKPRQFDWKETGITTTGFIAHELFEVCPHAVTGEKDATVMREYEVSPLVPATFDEEGKELTAAVAAVTGEHEVPRYQGVDTSFLVATLVKAIQEQQAIIESLTVRIATLESK